ncbi:hypothetical protein OGAPHI_002725 [Ogataea philodendri]|uniref:Uncharacterized protein n=1 Tax=Ogataea philodendri TaxID=1378263 RepID=A0A9P8PC58_9ASCO|nr:uncharacterized protein OGAPHI_002725 [Ogataea philodendri]KAH3668970.1 hypothetical protein OGAPHI_002725 [Ogataea philodendri]
MVTLSSSSTTTRYIQLLFGIILLGLSGKIINDRSSLTSLVNDLQELYNSTDSSSSISKRDYSEPSLNIDTTWKKSAIVLASACTSVGSNTANYAFPKLFTSRNTNQNTQAVLWKSSAFRTLSKSASDFVGKSAVTVSKSQTSYLTSLLGSEVTSHALWIVNVIMQISEYGSQSCSNVEGLLTAYNLTSDLADSILSNYYNLPDSSNSTSLDSELEEEIQELLSGANSTLANETISELLDSYASNNITTSELQSTLLLKLANNCKLKKASMALSILVIVAYVASSAFLSASAVSFSNKYKKQKSQVAQKTQEKEAKKNQPAPEGSQENEQETPKKEDEKEDLVHFVYHSDWLFPDVALEEELASYFA